MIAEFVDELFVRHIRTLCEIVTEIIKDLEKIFFKLKWKTIQYITVTINSGKHTNFENTIRLRENTFKKSLRKLWLLRSEHFT